jgi:hypothetical protein
MPNVQNLGSSRGDKKEPADTLRSKRFDTTGSASDDHIRHLLSLETAVDGINPTGRAAEKFARSSAPKR